MTHPSKLVCAVSILVFVGLASPAVAQGKLDVGIEYQVQRLFASGDGVNLPVGFNFDVAGKVARHVSTVAQVDWSRKSQSASSGACPLQQASMRPPSAAESG